jgi:chromosome segregation ATPase
VLVKKQDEVTRLNQEGARLVLELSHTKQSLYEQLTQGRKLEQKIEQLQSLQQHTGDLERQLASKTAESELLAERMKEVDAQLAPANARTRELELQLAEANAKALAQEQIGEQLRVYLDKIAAGPATAGGSEELIPFGKSLNSKIAQAATY